jgi:8-oxo-dGTP pyrophosphatase MutT (NUDIX family)
MAMSNYVRRVRAKMGNEFLLMPSVTGLVFDEQRRVLLVRPIHRDNVWVAPGGAVDPDEQPQDAVVREVWEETGLLVEPTELRGVFGGPEYRVWYANGDEVGYMMAVYECRPAGGSLKAGGDEISEARYFSADELGSITLSRWARVIVPHMMVNRGPWLAPVTWRPPHDSQVIPT